MNFQTSMPRFYKTVSTTFTRTLDHALAGTFLLATALLALPAFAQNSACAGQANATPATTGTSGALLNPLNASNFQQLLGEILQMAVVLGSVFLTLMLVYVGFLFVSARGNPEGVSKARTALLWTVIGGLILLGAQAIATVVVNTACAL